jgi:hypothetical protein
MTTVRRRAGGIDSDQLSHRRAYQVTADAPAVLNNRAEQGKLDAAFGGADDRAYTCRDSACRIMFHRCDFFR